MCHQELNSWGLTLAAGMHCPVMWFATFLIAVTGKIKLALAAGKANPAPPVGPALGSKVRNTYVVQLLAWTAHNVFTCQAYSGFHQRSRRTVN